MNRRKRFYILLCIVIGLCMTGCGKKEGALESAEATEIVSGTENTRESEKKTENTDAAESEEDNRQGEASSEEAEAALEEKVDYEALVKQHYTSQKEYEVQIAALVLAQLEQASYIEIPEEAGTDYQKMLTDALVDDMTDGSVLSEGVKSAIEAACEGKSVENIIEETASGLISETEDYLTGMIQDAVLGDMTEVFDCQVFSAASWIDEFFNANDVPVGLINGMVDRQKADIETIVSVVNSEQMREADLLYASALYKRVCARQKEIIEAGAQTTALGQQHRQQHWGSSMYWMH